MSSLLFLLQLGDGSPLDARADFPYLEFFIITICVIFLIVIITKILNYFGVGTGHAHRAGESPLFASRNEIKRAVAAYGFTKQQIDFFEQICKKYRIKNPVFLLKSDTAADNLFKTIYHSLDKLPSSESTENMKLLIFSIRQKIETHRRTSKGVITTEALPRNQEITISSKRLDNTKVMLVGNNPSGFLVSAPLNEENVEVELPFFTKVYGFFYVEETGLTYQFTSRVIRREVRHSAGALMLTHNKKMMPMHNRSFKRIELDKTCLYSPTKVTKRGSGSNMQTVYTPLSDRFRAALIDISGGGCCMRTKYSMERGSVISIELRLESTTEPIIGRVLRVNQDEEGGGYIVNVQFIRMKKNARNAIYTLIYNYNDED